MQCINEELQWVNRYGPHQIVVHVLINLSGIPSLIWTTVIILIFRLYSNQILKLQLLFGIAEELSDMRKQMKALEEKNVTYMKETMNLQEVKLLL